MASPVSRMPDSACQMPNGCGHPRWRSQECSRQAEVPADTRSWRWQPPGPRFGGANESPRMSPLVRSTLDPVLRIDPVRLEVTEQPSSSPTQPPAQLQLMSQLNSRFACASAVHPDPPRTLVTRHHTTESGADKTSALRLWASGVLRRWRRRLVASRARRCRDAVRGVCRALKISPRTVRWVDDRDCEDGLDRGGMEVGRGSKRALFCLFTCDGG